MDAHRVIAVMTALRDSGARCWVAGGWAVDALARHQTRPHADLDIAVDAADFDLGESVSNPREVGP